MNCPVVIIFFNRPDLLKKCIDQVRKVAPNKVFLVADGPREGNHSDQEKCQEAKEVARRSVDWPCQIFENFSETNLGCGQRPATGISWAFEHVDRAIILEDDCMADPSFFAYCENLLEYYSETPEVMTISGTNNGIHSGKESYYFSNIPLIWGWATWRRAWKHFDYSMTGSEDLPTTELAKMFDDNSIADQWKDKIQRHKNRRDVWDFCWTYASLKRNGMSIIPNKNMVSNIGFGDDATHTGNIRVAPLQAIKLPLIHPEAVSTSPKIQRKLYLKTYHPTNWKRVIKRKIRGILGIKSNK